MSCQSTSVGMCTWNTLKLGDFMLLQGGGTSKHVILQGGGTRGFAGVWIKCVMSNRLSVDVNLEYAQTWWFHAFTGWRNIKTCDFTGWRNRWMRRCLNKRCPIKSFLCGCEPRIRSNLVISCFYRVVEHQSVWFYRVEEHVD